MSDNKWQAYAEMRACRKRQHSRWQRKAQQLAGSAAGVTATAIATATALATGWQLQGLLSQSSPACVSISQCLGHALLRLPVEKRETQSMSAQGAT